MKLGINTNVFIDFPFTSFLGEIKNMGYKGVEIARTHPLHEKIDEELNEVKRMLKENNLEVYCIQGGIPHTDLNYAKKRIDLASVIGAKYVNMGPGIEVERNFKTNGAWTETAEIFSELADYAASRKVLVAIEPEPMIPLSSTRPLLSTYKEVKRMLNELASDNIGVILDIAHVHVAKENFSEVVNDLSGNIVVVHVSDIVDDRHYHFIPGKGDINFKAVLKVLHKSGFEDFLSVEVYPYFNEPKRAALESIRFLTNLLYEIDII
jgi:sugar phosphate isomerase/epimerase